ncbi:MAG: hypothetical protein ABSA84_05445 [Gammaproteobacteria bacterium]|jgi:hypothetical protein
MSKIKLGGAGVNSSITNLIKQNYSATGDVNGNDLILDKNTIAIKNVLQNVGNIKLINENKQTAIALYNMLPTLQDSIKENVILKISTVDARMKNYPSYQIFELNDKLSLAHSEIDIIKITEEAIEFMKEIHDMCSCYSVNIDSEQFSIYISIIKILFLCNRNGLKPTQEKVNLRELETILPHPFEPLEYLEVFTRLSPHALSLPLFRYEGSVWHFYSNYVIEFSERWQLNSYFSEYFTSIRGPVTYVDYDLSRIFGESLKSFNNKDIKEYLDLMLLAVNNLFRYFLNIKYFVDSYDVVDNLKILKSLSTLKLIFSDLKVMNISVLIYHRNAYGLSALDKISNLICHIKEPKDQDETKIFKQLLTDKYRLKILNIYKDKIENKTILEALSKMIKLCYMDLLKSTRQDNYQKAAELIYSIRNLKHGAALRAKQYDALFLENNVQLPEAITVIPLLIMVAMALDPVAYFSDPIVM